MAFLRINYHAALAAPPGSVDCESVLLGDRYPLPLPRVVGFRLEGVFNDFVTSTDVVVSIVKKLKANASLVRACVRAGVGQCVCSILLDLSLTSLRIEYMYASVYTFIR